MDEHLHHTHFLSRPSVQHSEETGGFQKSESPNRGSSYNTQNKTDVFVTSLDVFNRRAYVGSLSMPADALQGVDENVPIPGSSGHSKDNGQSRPFPGESQLSEDHQQSFSTDETAVCKIKHFSSMEAYNVANSVTDVLSDILGGQAFAQTCVSKELLLEKRHAFFQSLFTQTEDLQSALSCRFSLQNIEMLFEADNQHKSESGNLYQKRLTAIDELTKLLNA